MDIFYIRSESNLKNTTKTNLHIFYMLSEKFYKNVECEATRLEIETIF